ncbi:MAG: glutamine-hydrolyzing GMP synthase, partial [Candidatus Binatia bacterium]
MILVLDFGGQYTQLIARRVREAGVYCEIHPFNVDPERIRVLAPEGLILSGGPASVYDPGAPRIDSAVLDGIPVLGICYGMGLLCQFGGGEVARSERREYGPAELLIDDDGDLFAGLSRKSGERGETVWMSHGDRMETLPPGYDIIAHSQNSPIAAFRDRRRRWFGVQFHPEVAHTPRGTEILNNFLFRVCGCKADWSMESFVERE